jgi:TM2 domain-containing membrane protein YozV
VAGMNDDSTRTDGWGPAETSSDTAEKSNQGGPEADPQRVGFCQDCGKPLTQETLRTVGAGVFCDPCLAARVGASTPSAGYTTVPPYSALPPRPVSTSEPSPAIAALLGFIPGVGAMYNGQFAKGIVHLAIFAVLISLSDNVNGIFGLFAAGWIFYMAFEAYHTAVARRDGLPLPNAFGFNDIGERMGFGKTWGTVNPVRPVPGSTPPVTASQAQATYPVAGPAYAPVNPVTVGNSPDWVGYVPPSSFGHQPASPEANAAAAMSAQIRAQAMKDAGFGHAPYAETYTGTTQPYSAATTPAASTVPFTTGRRFPTGAIWLIALGVLILIANLLPDWKLTAQWWPPIFLAGLSVWLFTRRLRSGARLVCIIRWPIILMVLAVLLILHAAYVPITIGLAASILLIAFGALLLLERTAGAIPGAASPIDPAPYAEAPYTVAPGGNAQAAESPARAAWGAPGSEGAPHTADDTKGGQ